ncbi:hypothetical protein IFR04_008305 [Cadophora malorum]|uniref:Uncharacterized protein n=1 Tax=Cadophora malorum TaxID=108018 RepID=A0A8H7TBL9_9HELO|nr:hypothetical protein IFR04_008305 [Cadophora malorum]
MKGGNPSQALRASTDHEAKNTSSMAGPRRTRVNATPKARASIQDEDELSQGSGEGELEETVSRRDRSKISLRANEAAESSSSTNFPTTSSTSPLVE